MSGYSMFKNAQARERVLAEYEAVLERWPVPLERLRVTTAAGETAVLAFGPSEESAAALRGPGTAEAAPPRPPLFLLHGTGSNSSMWVGDAAALARGRRIFALDIPGEPGMSAETMLDWQSGNPGARAGGAHSGAGAAGIDAAAWLGEAIAALGFGGKPHSIAGLSLGGWIGLSYAIGRPEGLEALALLCPAGIGRSRPSFIAKAIAAGIFFGPRSAEIITRMLYGDEEPHPEAIRIGALMAGSFNARMESPRLFSDAELSGIAARVALWAGSKDALLDSRGSVARLGRVLPGAKIRLLAGRGHALPGLGEEMAGFLDCR